MMLRRLAAVALLGLDLAACAGPAGSASSESPDTTAALSRAAVQIVPDSRGGTTRQGTVLAYLPDAGFVRGTPEALATIGRPLQAAPGPNRTVEACRSTVLSEAVKLGARTVEAVSAGRHRRDTRGRYVGPVLVRITYPRRDVVEVRLATLTCVVDQSGAVVEAFA